MANIVLLRGTSGSGKTYIAQQIIAAAGRSSHGPTELHLGPKSKVGGYAWDEPPLLVLGRYDAACGGCDTQSWKGAADDQELLIYERGICDEYRRRSVLLEGLMVSSWGVERLKRLRDRAEGTGGTLTVIHLQTPLETCLDAVRGRRAEREARTGRQLPPLNTKNTEEKHRTLEICSKMNERNGVTVERLDRAAAWTRAAQLLLGGAK